MATQITTDSLTSLPLFASCTNRELRKIMALVDSSTVPAGTALTTEGDLGSQAFVIVDGQAEATIRGNVVATLGAGDVVGEMALLDRRGARSATVTATTEVQMLVIEPRAFETLMAQFPTVSRHIALGLAQRLRTADGAVAV